MKLLFFFITLLLTISTYGSDKGYYYKNISQKYDDLVDSHFDITDYSKTVIAGRCYYKESQIPLGALFILKTISLDNGPIGTPNEKVTLGRILTSQNSNEFDNITFDRLGSIIRDPETLYELNYIDSTNSYNFRSNSIRRDHTGFFYTISYNDNGQRMGCYFYKENY